jgi:hypothetical protein
MVLPLLSDCWDYICEPPCLEKFLLSTVKGEEVLPAAGVEVLWGLMDKSCLFPKELVIMRQSSSRVSPGAGAGSPPACTPGPKKTFVGGAASLSSTPALSLC